MLQFRLALGIFLTLTLTTVVHAKVASQSPNGFIAAHKAVVPTEPKAAYDAFVRIGEWWNGSHSYSGDPKNFAMEVKPGGCWCETLPDGGFVRHMDVVQATPGRRLVLSGGLGPLLFMGVAGSMTISFEAREQSTLVKLDYAVGGYDPKKFKDLPALVDGVLAEQFARYVKFAATGQP